MTLNRLTLLSLLPLLLASCVNDANNSPDIDEPATYTFSRNDASTVSFSGQTARIKMAGELISAMLDFENSTEEHLLEMYRNQTENGGDADPFSEPALNSETKNIRSKVAASRDYFSANTTVGTEIKNYFEDLIGAQVNEVFPNRNQIATPGQPGQIADGSSTRYISAKGIEYNQLVAKGLIGALMTDQILNNYLSKSVLDEGTNIADNDAGITETGSSYTTMEHKWDEAYGYLYGTSQDPANPNTTIGDDDAFLNKYTGQVSEDADFSGLAGDIFNAFKRGRAAIVAGAYDERDEQTEILRESISTVIAVRSIYYLQAAKSSIEQSTPNYGSAFHSLSEGLGFIYSLKFTRNPGTGAAYFSHEEVNSMIEDLLDDGPNGLWDITPETLDSVSEEIASRFDFSVEQAAQ